MAALVALWAVFQLLNYKCHKILGDLRRSPERKDEERKDDECYTNHTKARKIPHGFGFGQVSCANYLCQAQGWLVYSLLTRNYTSYILTLLSVAQMAKWAIDKHGRYLKEFKEGYPRTGRPCFPSSSEPL